MRKDIRSHKKMHPAAAPLLLLFLSIIVFSPLGTQGAQGAQGAQVSTTSAASMFFAPPGDSPRGKDKYLGQKPPGKDAVIFAPGIVSTPQKNEFCCAFSPDGKEFYFNRGLVIMVSQWQKGQWTQPAPVAFTQGFRSHEPHITADNQRLFYGSMRPRPGFPNEKHPYGIWMTKQTPRGWGKPSYVGYAMYVTTSRTGGIYATKVTGPMTEQGIVKTALKNGRFTPLVKQKGGVVTPAPDRLPGRHPCIAPDESFIVFDAYEKESEGNGKLLSVSLKAKTGGDRPSNWGIM